MMRSNGTGMRDRIARVFFAIMQFAHRVIVGGHASQKMMQFAKHLSLTIVSGTTAFVLLFVTNVIVARVLGPEEYGQYAIIFSVAQIMTLLFTLELDVSALYFLSGKTQGQKIIISSILIMFAINVVVFTIVAHSIYVFFDMQNMSHVALWCAVAIAVVYAWKRLVDAFLRAQEKFFAQAALRVLEASVVCVGVLLLFFVFEKVDLYAYVWSIIGGAIVFGVGSAIVIRTILSVGHATIASINEIFHYNVYGLVNAVVNGIVKNVDTLIVAAVLGATQAGVYAVYFTAVVVFGARVTQLVMSVFFPVVRAQSERIHRVHAKVTTIMIRTILPIIICASVGISGVVWLYGSAYPFVWQWVVLGGVYIGIHFFASLYGGMLSSVSREGYRQHNLSFVWGFLVYCVIVGSAYIVGALSITVMIGAMIAYRTVAGICACHKLQKLS